MLAPDILKKIHTIELHTKKILGGMLIGQNRSKYKGTGFDFDQTREYQQGDDIRFIDWKGSARHNKLLIKQYNEESSRTVMLMVDGSSSGLFTSGKVRKFDVQAQVAVILALVADHTKDAVGIVIFSDKIEIVLPPASGRMQVAKIINTLFNFIPHGATDINVAFEYIARMKQSDVMGFIISDFIDAHVNQNISSMRHAGLKGDIIAIQCLDQKEHGLHVSGFMHVQDLETGQIVPCDVHSIQRKKLNTFLQQRLIDQRRLFKKNGIDFLSLSLEHDTDHVFISDVIRFFAQRALRS